MEAVELMQGAIGMIKMVSPFLFIFIAVSCANEIIGLIRNAVLYQSRSKDRW